MTRVQWEVYSCTCYDKKGFVSVLLMKASGPCRSQKSRFDILTLDYILDLV